MAQSINLGGSTYLDASAVEMNASSSTYRKTLADAVPYGCVESGSISASGSTTYSYSTGVYLIVINGSLAVAKYVGFMIGYNNFDSNRTVLVDVYAYSSSPAITLTGSTSAAEVTITNGSSATVSYAIYKLL